MKKSSLNARYLFIKPPGLEELEPRLRNRKSETEEEIKLRLKTAVKELEYAEQPGVHDKIVINDSVERAYSEIEGFALED